MQEKLEFGVFSRIDNWISHFLKNIFPFEIIPVQKQSFWARLLIIELFTLPKQQHAIRKGETATKQIEIQEENVKFENCLYHKLLILFIIYWSFN